MTFDDLIEERIRSRIKELVAAIQTEETLHDFSWALDMLKQGRKVARKGWEADSSEPKLGLGRNWSEAPTITRRFRLRLKNDWAEAEWRPIQEDILANDWYEVQ